MKLPVLDSYKIDGQAAGAAVEEIDILDTVQTETTSGTTLTGTITTAVVGKLVLVSVTTRTAITGVTAGWTLLTTSQIIPTGNQRNYIYYKIAESTSEAIQITTGVAGRIYITLLAFNTAKVPVEDASMSLLSSTYNAFTYTKPAAKKYVVVASFYYWPTSTPYAPWTISPSIFHFANLSYSTQRRQLTLFDIGDPVARTCTAPTSGSDDSYKVAICAVYFE